MVTVVVTLSVVFVTVSWTGTDGSGPNTACVDVDAVRMEDTVRLDTEVAAEHADVVCNEAETASLDRVLATNDTLAIWLTPRENEHMV